MDLWEPSRLHRYAVARIITATGDGTGNNSDAPYDIVVDALENVYVSGRNSDNVSLITPEAVIAEIFNGTGISRSNYGHIIAPGARHVHRSIRTNRDPKRDG